MPNPLWECECGVTMEKVGEFEWKCPACEEKGKDYWIKELVKNDNSNK